MPKKEPLYRDQQPRRADRNVKGQLASDYLRRPPGYPQPDAEPPNVPPFASASFSSGIDSQATSVRAYVTVTWTRNSEVNCAGYRLRYRPVLVSGTGTGSTNLYTVTSSDSPVTDLTPDGYINCVLVDSDGEEFTITDNDATTLTVSGTPASGSFSIKGAWVILAVQQVPAGQDVTVTIRNLALETEYEFSAEAVDLWNQESGYSANVSYTTPTWTIPLNPPLNVTVEFTGRNVELSWEAPAEAGPEQDYKIEVYDQEGGTLLETYYVDATHFTLTFEEIIRLTKLSGIKSQFYFLVYTHDVLGNSSDGTGVTGTNERPAAPTNLKTDATRADFSIEYDINPEDDITHYEFEVILGSA